MRLRWMGWVWWVFQTSFLKHVCLCNFGVCLEKHPCHFVVGTTRWEVCGAHRFLGKNPRSHGTPQSFPPTVLPCWWGIACVSYRRGDTRSWSACHTRSDVFIVRNMTNHELQGNPYPIVFRNSIFPDGQSTGSLSPFGEETHSPKSHGLEESVCTVYRFYMSMPQQLGI